MRRFMIILFLFFFGVASAQAPQRMTDFDPVDKPPVEREIAEAPVIRAGIPDGMHLLEGPRRLILQNLTEACQLSKYELGNPWYNGNWESGDRSVTFFDPIDCPETPTYPFEITSLDFQLHVFAGSYPVDVDIVVFDMLDPDDECQGPGAELYRFSYLCDESFEFPNVGTAPFPEPYCIWGQFFIGIEYRDPVEASIIFDSNYPVYCENWAVYEGSDWQDWTDVSELGYFAFWVNGETNWPDCQQDIPTLSEWGMIVFGLLIIAIGTAAIIRGRHSTLFPQACGNEDADCIS